MYGCFPYSFDGRSEVIHSTNIAKTASAVYSIIIIRYKNLSI
ncbi:hypothetical protein HMPREF9141_2017 [Prevotella multiformis DSM 16608]|uniref:Uncharacterized protein n=1 Tax=Prevotella multiformis DSM 16608 TaxID=888743 RepID=F0F8V0_9BACT|nr:hypothetical protein HMPREF9141_2017 [Prevotella multiformis DSM 16608]